MGDNGGGAAAEPDAFELGPEPDVVVRPQGPPGFIGPVPEWDPQLIKKAPNGLPIKAYERTENSVCEPPADSFEVRGKDYLYDRQKIQAATPIFSMVDVRPFSHAAPVWHAAARLKPLRDFLVRRKLPAACRALQHLTTLAAHPDREFFIANRVLPLDRAVHVMAIFCRTQDETVDPVFERCWTRYKAGNEVYRNARLKYMAKIPNASFMVKSAVGALGGFRPVIMGKGYLDLKHFDGPNYTEVDIDIGSSRIARGVVGVVIPQAKKMMVDEAFFIEGQQEDELPERLLGVCRCARYDLEGNTVYITADMLVGSGPAPEPSSGPASVALRRDGTVQLDELPKADRVPVDADEGAISAAAAKETVEALFGTDEEATDASDDDEFHDAVCDPL